MTVIAHRDLRNRSSEILRAVQAGETFEVTNHGVVVAVIGPPEKDPLAGLTYREPTSSAPFSEIRSVRRDESTADVLTELRGER